jgi:hypothetical protein
MLAVVLGRAGGEETEVVGRDTGSAPPALVLELKMKPLPP